MAPPPSSAGNHPPPGTLLEVDFSQSQISDADPAALGRGQIQFALNFMLDKPGVAYKRGGSTYVGGECGTGAVLRTEIAEFPGPGITENLAWSSDLRLYQLVAGAWAAT